MTAGMPTPSYAAPQTESPAGSDGADPGDPVDVAHGVLRQPAAPALHVGVDGLGDDAGQLRAGRRATARPAPRRAPGGVASSRWRPSEVRSRAARRRPHAPSPTWRRRTSTALIVALLDRRHQEARPVSESGQGRCAGRRASRRRRSPTRSRRARPRPTGDGEASSRAVGAAGVASTTRPACTVSGVVRRADGERPARRRTTQRAHGRVECAPRDRPSHERPGRRPMPPGEPGEDRDVDCAAPRRPARGASRGAAMASSWGTVAAAEIWRARPAYTPPSSGSTSRSTTSSPSRAATRSPTEMSSSTGGDDLRAGAGQPVGRQHAGRGQLVEVERHAHQRPRQRPQRTARPDARRRRRRVHDLERRARGPASTPSGRRLSIASAPTSTRHPGDLGEAQLAADHGRALQQQHVVVGAPGHAGGGQAGDPATDHDDAQAVGGHACEPR